VRLTAPIVALGLLVAPGSAAAEDVPCVIDDPGGPTCQSLEARVKWAADGDTLRPQIKRGGKWSAKQTVRVTGIQAPELYDYSRDSRRGECLAVEAAKTLDRLVHEHELRLVSMSLSAGSGARGRLHSTFQVKQGGRWIDPATVLLEKGLVLWDPDGDEWLWNDLYSRLAEEAARRGVGLWNPVACGKPGPSPSSSLRLKVKWNGDGRDNIAISEWVRITNEDSQNPVPLAGWRLRDASTRLDGEDGRRAYLFPAGATVPPGSSIVVRVGPGTDTPGVFHWGLSKPLFQNAGDGKPLSGDGAYLFDPDLEMRAFVQYPCRATCSDPLDNQVAIAARYIGVVHEWITITNLSSQWLSLHEYEIENVPWFYEFGPHDVLAPGKGITLWVRQPHDVPAEISGDKVLVTPQPGVALPGLTDFALTTSFLSWNYDGPMLADDGDVVVLRNPRGAPVAGTCFGWGGQPCPIR
jgi:endonuclease YncB( thermonuclease family)